MKNNPQQAQLNQMQTNIQAQQQLQQQMHQQQQQQGNVHLFL